MIHSQLVPVLKDRKVNHGQNFSRTLPCNQVTVITCAELNHQAAYTCCSLNFHLTNLIRKVIIIYDKLWWWVHKAPRSYSWRSRWVWVRMPCRSSAVAALYISMTYLWYSPLISTYTPMNALQCWLMKGTKVYRFFMALFYIKKQKTTLLCFMQMWI